MNKIAFIFLIIGSLLTVYTVYRLATPRTAEDILNHHLQSFGSADLDGILSDYSYDAFMIINNKIFSGNENRRAIFRQWFKDFGNGVINLLGKAIKDNIIEITWSYRPNNTATNTTYLLTDTFVIHRGMIRSHLLFSTFYDEFPVQGVTENGAVEEFLTRTRTTQEVWNHRVQAFKNHDLNGILSDYNNDSFLILNSKLFTGKDEIKAAHEQLFALYSSGKYTLLNTTITDNIIYLTKSFQPNDTPTKVFYGTDSFVVQNGMIQAQTITNFFS